ncbi:ABC transporter substrate-binding protein [Pseudarthrobacter sp. fls2-241-R2A-127]|uniref:ABC transporter substrate-binding protein n=1 Tax=Pseudarthrobacter sp. fls2-241-R2A-127 TaxID=3040303 RepID=UPI0025536325|nr:ABC transporter substrate-binding protein [Pseudarthrobacter sp. fls2-241-R2A-127]
MTKVLRPRAVRTGGSVVAVGLTLALGLTACSAPAKEASQESRTLAFAIGGQPSSFDPAQAEVGEAAYIWTGIYDTLLKVDADGAVKPSAAKSWEYSSDAMTLTLDLRDGLKFSDGAEVTSEDVAATIERSRTTPGIRVPDLASVKSVDTPDDHTVVLNLSKPDPALLVNLATGAGIIAEAKKLGDENLALDPIGSGPYVLDKNATVNGSTYVLKRRDDYWDLQDYPYKTVTIRVIEDSQAKFNALQAGELDAGTASAAQIATLPEGAFEKKKIEAQAWGGLLFLDRTGSVVPALGDKRVREAINMAFDRDLYAKQLMSGGARATSQFYNPIQSGYDPDLEGYYKHDPEGARKLLAEAGYPDGFALTMPSSYFSHTFEPAITQSLADIGIKVTWESVPPQDVFPSLSSGKYGMAWYFEGLNSPSIQTRANLQKGGALNPSGYESPELNSLLSEAAQTTDPDAQGAVYKRINRYSVENALVAPLVYSSGTWLTKPGVKYLPNGAVPIYLSNIGAN